MANNVGVFTKSVDGSYAGTLTTLTLSFPVRLDPVEEKSGENAPDFRVMSGAAELGAGWIKTAKTTGEEYIRLTADDPSFPAPMSLSLYHQPDNTWKLVWERR